MSLLRRDLLRKDKNETRNYNWLCNGKNFMKMSNIIKSRQDQMRMFLKDYIIMVYFIKLIEKKTVEEE